MSRAFVKETDGWFYCIKKRKDCMFANQNRRCLLLKCKYENTKDIDAEIKNQDNKEKSS